MKNSTDLIYRIAQKLDQSEKGYSVPMITYLDNKQTILLEFSDVVGNVKKYIINAIEITDLQ